MLLQHCPDNALGLFCVVLSFGGKVVFLQCFVVGGIKQPVEAALRLHDSGSHTAVRVDSLDPRSALHESEYSNKPPGSRGGSNHSHRKRPVFGFF